MAISPRLSTARLGAASSPTGGPAPLSDTGVAKVRQTGISVTQSETTRRRDSAFRARRRIFFRQASCGGAADATFAAARIELYS